MTNIARFQTDLREKDLDPSETKKGKGMLGTVSTEHHGMTRSGDRVSMPQRTFSAHPVFDLSSGVLTSALPYGDRALVDLFGHNSLAFLDVNVNAARVSATTLFELERMMTRPLAQLDLIDVKEDAHGGLATAEYITAIRADLAAFLERYHQQVAASRLQKPLIEQYFISQQGRTNPEDLQRVFGGQLYRTLQETYDPRKGKKK